MFLTGQRAPCELAIGTAGRGKQIQGNRGDPSPKAVTVTVGSAGRQGVRAKDEGTRPQVKRRSKTISAWSLLLKIKHGLRFPHRELC